MKQRDEPVRHAPVDGLRTGSGDNSLSFDSAHRLWWWIKKNEVDGGSVVNGLRYYAKELYCY
jgi:hypothetical protein